MFTCYTLGALSANDHKSTILQGMQYLKYTPACSSCNVKISGDEVEDCRSRAILEERAGARRRPGKPAILRSSIYIVHKYYIPTTLTRASRL